VRVCIEIGWDQTRFSFVCQNHRRRIDVSRGRYEKDPLTPLRQERETIYDAVGPAIAALLERFDQGAHAASLVQLQHERNVLKHDPRHTPAIEKTEDFTH
jgi:hypothetical protein